MRVVIAVVSKPSESVGTLSCTSCPRCGSVAVRFLAFTSAGSSSVENKAIGVAVGIRGPLNRYPLTNERAREILRSPATACDRARR